MPVDPRLAAFIGTWRGQGQGTLPDTPPFAYEEEMRFVDVGTRDMLYLQRAWDPATEETLHAEAGIWRLLEVMPDVHVLVATFAQPRRTEVAEGPLQDGHTILVSTKTAAVRGALRVNTEREYRAASDQLTYEFSMAIGLRRPKPHLSGTLRRVVDPPPSA